ncbi:MAG: hypothetical protein NTU63_01710 [Candidatus Pacearchaeota archaeon]|nr:hypothetical protein [Candidatus Pacearchaeota archaeon]
MIKADIHNHLGRNRANPGFDETIDIAHARLGDGGLFGIANSDDFRYEKFVEQKGGEYNRNHVSGDIGIYVPEKKIFAVKCQEIFSKQGDILAIAMPHGKNVKSKDARDAIREARDLGAFLDAVHPFYIDGIGKFLEQNPELLQLFSTWEVYNGSAVFVPGFTIAFANKKAMEFYSSNLLEKLGIGMSSSTDGHSAKSIGKCYTELPDMPFTSKKFWNLSWDLDAAFRSVKFLDKLHMESNWFDAYKHVKEMAMVKAGLRK